MDKQDLRDILSPFILVARHVRNFPHPQLPLGLLKTEAVKAERKARELLGEDLYEEICEHVFDGQ